jgi:hypothetical protein
VNKKSVQEYDALLYAIIILPIEEICEVTSLGLVCDKKAWEPASLQRTSPIDGMTDTESSEQQGTLRSSLARNSDSSSIEDLTKLRKRLGIINFPAYLVWKMAL